MGAFLKWVWPYLIAIAIGAGGAWFIESNIAAKHLAIEKAGRAADKQAAAERMKAVSDAALKAQTDSAKAAEAAQAQIAGFEQQLQEQREIDEKANLQYQSSLASGAQRLRVRTSACIPSGGSPAVQGAAASSVGNDTPGYADIDPAVSSALYGLTYKGDRYREQLIYLEGYIRTLEDQGFIIKPDSALSAAAFKLDK